MKVRCRKIISSTTEEDLGNTSPWLSIDKEYIVLAIEVSLQSGISILIQTDHYNEPVFIALQGFEIMSQHIPSNWITHINGDIVAILPKSWLYNSFFEDLEDQEAKAMELFKKESELIYNEESL